MRRNLNNFILLILSMSLLMACSPKEIVSESEIVNVASLKGPTTIGMAKMIDDTQKNNNSMNTDPKTKYSFQQFSLAEEIVNGLMKDEVDLATIPANLAASIYNKSNGKIEVLSINTLGVLYIVENGENINSLNDLHGKTIYSLGKGTTPEGVLNSFIEKNNLKDVQVEYRSEASEIAALLKNQNDIIAMIPEPFVSLVKSGNENIRTIFDMNEEWKKINDGNSIVTGVLIARKDFLRDNPNLIKSFLNEYKKSIEFARNNPGETAPIIESMGIVPEGIGTLAIPNCNIEYIDGKDMIELLGSYLDDLYNFNPQLIGGSVPENNFYYK